MPAADRLVMTPTAATVPKHRLQMETLLFDGGGVTQRMSFGLTSLISLGVSYGGGNVLGSSRVMWQPHAGARLHIRIVEETMTGPGVAVGLDTQGHGPYDTTADRFAVKSRGAYIVLSRNYELFGTFGLHGGINYSLENSDGDYDPSFWAGFDKSLYGGFELCGEYDFATNDNENRTLAGDEGYLNACLRWNISPAFAMEFIAADILTFSRLGGSGGRNHEPARELRFIYRGGL